MSFRSVIGAVFLRAYKWCNKSGNETVQEECLNALTPTRLSDEEFSLYEKEFSFVFNSPGIRNVALMGPYGAGKSTVIETWSDNQRDDGDGHICTFISLAHFRGSNDDANAIEGEILNQLIHKTSPSRVPKSRFRHTQNNRKIVDLLKAMGCIAYGLLTVILFALLFRDGIMFPGSTALTHPWWIALWCVGSVVVLYSAIRRDKADKLLRRIKILGNEVDLFEINEGQRGKGDSEPNDPIFNKYMDDVLYLLNSSGSDVYIFEDLDRFSDSIEIFEKLRELNILANGCRPQSQGTLRFFFLVREDLFETPEDRVKFFDFIIPVIPFADSDGNFDELRVGLQSLKLNVSDLFVYEISAFIPDSRTLKEIVNEVKHYQTHVFHNSDEPLTENEAEHLVAIVTYKVVFPTDFSHYQRGKGYVAELLKKREEIIDSKQKELNSEKSSLEEEIQEIKEKNRFSLEELALVSCGNLSKFDRAVSVYGGAPVSDKGSLQEMIDVIRASERASELLDEEMDKFSDDEERQKRFAAPKEALDTREKDCLARIQEIDQELSQLKCLALGELLSGYNDDTQFEINKEDLGRPADFEDCQIDSVQTSPHFPLLKHLIITDLLDASSMRYVIRVRPDGLPLGDQRNLATIQSRGAIDPAYVFAKPGDVLMRIRDEYLMVPGVQNYSILTEILDKGDVTKLESFISGLRRGQHAGFFLGYALSDQFSSSVFNVMESEFDNEAEIILANQASPIDWRRGFAHRLIAHMDSWNSDDTKRALVEFANVDSKILSTDDALLEEVRNNLDKLPLVLSDIDFETADDVLLDIIYEKSLYQPNAALVAKWVDSRFPYYVVNRRSIASIVFSLPGEKLHQLVESNMEVFVASALEANNGVLAESEDVLVWMLNGLSGKQEAVVNLVSRLRNCALCDLSRVREASSKRALMLFDIPVFSEKNVLDYFNSFDGMIDDALSKHIHGHLESGEYQQAEIDALSNDENFVTAVIESATLNDKDVKILLSGKGSALLSNFNNEDLGQSRVGVTLRASRVPVTEDNVRFIRGHYPDCEWLLAGSDIDAYLGLFDDDVKSIEFDEDVGLKLLESNQIDHSKKVEIAKLFESPIRLKAIYSDLLKIEIINNHFDLADLASLPSDFEIGGEQLKEVIEKKAATHADDFICGNLPMSCNLLCAVLRDPGIAHDDKLKLIASQLNLPDSQITSRAFVRSCFEAAGFEKYVRLMDGKRARVPDDNANSNVINALVKRGMCSEKVEPGANGFVIVSPKGYGRKRLI